ncbi:histidine--tRNA ligase [Phycisphaerales bacterium AB-hyl4]|uniref:Histidine--tRNA ligase n=1 Tax=Natronomicrosphaera hydrolytica TaxID=3242702 RepID=A0ABV4U882_9BACT
MKLQAPKGTRDFYPHDMAWRNHLHDAWRRVSIRHGFEQVDGPIFETLDLYKVKSGEGIVSELFHFEDRGGRGMAIRPEFTPTLARMVAAQANALPKPIKWFCTPNLCRAERPQRGRLREFFQWNVDILGSDAAVADAECILVAIDLLQELGLKPEHVRVKISHRQTVRHILSLLGVSDEKMEDAFDLLDRRDKIEPEAFQKRAGELGLDEPRVARFDQTCRYKYKVGSLGGLKKSLGIDGDELAALEALDQQLLDFGIADWCEYDLGIVRGLAYYTGTVFEVHEATGVERAMAGGGRYDQLIELFGGPATPAVGFGMGDVVLTNVLADKGLIPEDVSPRPDVYVLAATEAGGHKLGGVVASLRQQGVHARLSYRATRNISKLLKEAGSARARFALILDDEAANGTGQLKDLESGEQEIVKFDAVARRVKV